MSDQQKIWFIYLTDHHEGPFTAGEVAQKAQAGAVTGQSLAWKDGMPEWVAAETIPELQEAMNPPAAAGSGLVISGGNSRLITAPQAVSPVAAASPMEAIAAAAAAAQPAQTAAPEAKGDVSLAQLLASTQGTRPDGATNPSIASSGTKSGGISDSASVLSSMMKEAQAQSPVTSGSGVSLSGTLAPSSAAGEPAPEDEVWTLKIGAQVTGLYSLNKLMELAATTGVPEDAMLWHSGWSDFQSIAVVPQLEVARKARATRASGTKSNMARPGVAVSAMSNAAAQGDEESTDTGIIAPAAPGWKGKLAGFAAQAKGLTKKIAAAMPKKKKKGEAAENTGSTLAPKGGKKIAVAVAPVGKKGAKGAGRTRMLILLGGALMLAGAGAGVWFLFLRSPIPSDLDVNEEDKESMVAAVKQKEGHKLVLAQAKGTEDNPADPSSPKYYVASNLPEGAQISLQVTGISGTLVNRVSFEKTFTANVEKTHLAVFDQVKENGKPLWGEFNFKATAEGAEPAEVKSKFIGTKGGAYTNRLKTYKDSVQGEYDGEVGELREYISTLKNLQAEASKQIAEYKTNWQQPVNRTKINADWALLRTNSQNLLSQVQQKLKDRLGGTNSPKYHLRAFQDVSTTVGQLEQLVKLHGDRLSGAVPGIGNPDELDGLVQAGVLALEQWLASAVAKNPFDASMQHSDPAKGGSPLPSPPPSPPPAGAAAPAPAPAAAPSPAPAANPAPAAAPPAPAPAPTPSH